MSNKSVLDNFVTSQMKQTINIGNLTSRPVSNATPNTPTPEERMALEERRNANRGRRAGGEAAGNYKRVGFICDRSILDKFETIPYKTGKIKRELFEEALSYIVEKYS